MSAESTTSQHILHDLIQSAREQLLVIQTYSPECSSDSPAQLAFDPYIARRLQMFTPIRVIPPPDLQKTCDAIERLLDGLDEISLLKDTNELLTWEVSFYFLRLQ
jgi:N-alpha-acetyltransferase 35, NatC auxiliary subunit